MNVMNSTMFRNGESSSEGAILQDVHGEREMARAKIRVIDDFAELSADERLEWDAIAARQAVTVPFQSLFWNETWWRHFGAASRWGQKSLRLYVVESGGEIIAFFPMLRQTFSAAGLPLLRYIQPLGSDNNLTELRTGIVREGCEIAAYHALVDHLQNSERGWEVVSLPSGPEQVSDLYDAVSVGHPSIPLIEGFAIPLADDWDSFRSGLKRNIKESIRKCYNSFKRDGVELQFSCLQDAEDIRGMLPEFYRLHVMRSAQEGGNDHRDAFEAEQARNFLDLLAKDAKASGLRLFLMRHEGRLIAARLGFEMPQGTYLYYSGYDLGYGKYSVATRLVIEVIRHEIEAGRKFVHLSFGRDVSKTRWSPQESVFKWNLMFRKSVRGSLAAFALTSLMRLKRRGYARANTIDRNAGESSSSP